MSSVDSRHTRIYSNCPRSNKESYSTLPDAWVLPAPPRTPGLATAKTQIMDGIIFNQSEKTFRSSGSDWFIRSGLKIS